MAQRLPVIMLNGRLTQLPAGDAVHGAAPEVTTDGLYKLRRSGGVFTWEVDTSPTYVYLAADSTSNATTTLTNSLLTFPVVAGGIYRFRAFVAYNTNTGTTGIRVAPNGPAFSRLRHTQTRATAAGTSQFVYGQSAWQLPMTATTNSPTGGGELTIEGTVSITAAGSITIQFASEVAAAPVSLLAGSYIEYRRVN